MAAKKRKSQSASRNAGRRKNNSKSKVKLSRVQMVVLEIAAVTVCILVMFRLGKAGSILFGLFNLLFGYMTWLILPMIIFFIGYDWATLHKKRIPRRYSWGSAILIIATSMTFAYSAMDNDPFGPLKVMVDQASQILTGAWTDPGGLMGDLSVGIAAALFSKKGALIVIISLFVISGFLVLWDFLKSMAAMVAESFHQDEDEEEEASFRELQDDQEEKKKPRKKRSRKKDDSSNSLLEFDNPINPADQRTPDFSSYFNDGNEQTPDQPESGSGSDFNFGMEPASAPSKKKPKKSRKEQKKEQEEIESVATAGTQTPGRKPGNDSYRLPDVSLLANPPAANASNANAAHAKQDGQRLIKVLDDFGIPAKLGEVHIGPTVTKFEVIPGTGVRISQILNLQNNIKMALAAKDIRIEAPIPGKSAVGIEVPNARKTMVSMKEMAVALNKSGHKSHLMLCLGRDLMGEAVFGELDQMPHLLIAGATGSGKSVCMNSIICSFLLKNKPSDVKLVLIDPKKVEFTPYNGIPHLLSPVVTDPDMANKTLKVIVAMMDKRYDLFSSVEVRNINGYNAFVDQHPEAHLARMPRIVVIIDELADLMTTSGKEVESSIQRITQLARAAGIHMIVATQRPSVNVITGVIKSNIPSRIAFSVSSATDSRTILDKAGAERLLGNGDMLFLDNGASSPVRVQGVFIQDEEVKALAEAVKEQAVPEYDEAFLTLKDIQTQAKEVRTDDNDPLYDEIKDYVIKSGKASTSNIQRVFGIGYQKAARYMDYLEANGIIGPSRGAKPREVLVRSDQPVPESEEGEE